MNLKSTTTMTWMMTATLLATTGCAKPVFESSELPNIVQSRPQPSPEESHTSPEPIPTPLPPVEPPGLLEKMSLLQDDAANKVDILIVNDNSFSMYYEQMKMASKFPDFISSLKDIDAHIGMTTTDPEASQNKKPGQLLNWDGLVSQVLTPKTQNAAAIFEKSVARKETLNCSGGFNCPSSDEQPLLNVIQALSSAQTLNSGFFRDGADLAVVVLSDEDEGSDGPSWATKPAALVNAFKATYGQSKKLVVHGIVVRPGDQTCLKIQQNQAGAVAGSSYGNYVAEAARLTGGIVGDICADDYTSQLRAISKATRRLLTVFKLDHAPLAGSVKVVLTPYEDIAFSVEGKQITFAKPPAPGTRIDIEYRH